MRFVLTPVGSAGDVNPFVIVGRELRRRGHAVTLIAPEVFGGVATTAGLDFVPLGTAAEYERTTNDPDLWNPRRGPKVVFGEVTRQLEAGYAAIERVYEQGRTCLVGHSLSFYTRVFEERRRAPAVTVHLSPSIFRSDFAEAALPTGGSLSAWPASIRRTLWRAIDRFAIDPLIAPALNRWRAELGLAPVRRVLKSWIHSPQRVVGLFPEWFGEPQPDWPSQLILTGFVLSDEACNPHPPTPDDGGVESFLAAGDPPIVFTPGSANRFAEAFFRAGVDAANRAGRRALLVTRFGEHLPSPLPPHAFHAPYAAFFTLFPRAAAIVHHGGIGTCAQALAAGVPQLIMPMGFDQPDNAARIRRLGAGDAIRPARFTASNVARALQRLVSDPNVRAACERWTMEIHRSNALADTCDAIVSAAR